MSDHEASMVRLKAIRTRLERIMKPAGIRRWLITPNPAFGGKAPHDMIASGDIEPIERMIFELESGVSF